MANTLRVREHLSDPAQHAFAIAPADNDFADGVAVAVYVGTGGDVKVTTVLGDAVTFVAYPGGAWLPVSVKRVWLTGTNASNMVGVY